MADEEVQTEKKGFGGMKLIIIIAAVVILVGAGGFFLGKILAGGSDIKDPVKVENGNGQDPANTSLEKQTQTTDQKNPDGSTKDPLTNGTEEAQGLLALEKFTVNLNDPFGRRYAEILINLKIARKSLVSKIQEHELLLPQIRDEIFMIISSKSYPELNSVSGKVTLKEEIMIRINELIKDTMGQEPVQDVFFGNFIIQ